MKLDFVIRLKSRKGQKLNFISQAFKKGNPNITSFANASKAAFVPSLSSASFSPVPKIFGK
jgi:hypothetical protein